jgi:photosystem II stability/assembly factor-like uncharacterized protein
MWAVKGPPILTTAVANPNWNETAEKNVGKLLERITKNRCVGVGTKNFY